MNLKLTVEYIVCKYTACVQRSYITVYGRYLQFQFINIYEMMQTIW